MSDEAAERDRMPIELVLPGIKLPPIDDAKGILFVFALIKYLYGDEPAEQLDRSWAYRTSSAPNREELLGALLVQVKLLEKELATEWSSGQADDDEGDEDDRRWAPIQDVLPGIKLHPLGDAKEIEFVLALVKYLDGEEAEDEQDRNWAFLASSTLNRAELLGALRIQVRILEEELVMEWSSDGDDD